MAAVTARSSTRTTTITTTPKLVAVDVRPVLFNIGVNEMQTVANATGSTKMQTDINRTGLKKMQLYLEDFEKFQERFDSSASASGAGGAGGVAVSSGAGSFVVPWRDEALKCRGLLSTIGAMIDAEESASAGTKSKNVDLLLASSFAARILNGARTTSCKSAKDRTSMFHTLEAVRLAQQKELRSGKEIGRVGSLSKRQVAEIREKEAEAEAEAEAGGHLPRMRRGWLSRGPSRRGRARCWTAATRRRSRPSWTCCGGRRACGCRTRGITSVRWLFHSTSSR